MRVFQLKPPLHAAATATKQLLTMLNAADVVVQEAAQIAMIGFM